MVDMECGFSLNFAATGRTFVAATADYLVANVSMNFENQEFTTKSLLENACRVGFVFASQLVLTLGALLSRYLVL